MTGALSTPGGRAAMAIAFTVATAAGFMLFAGSAAYDWIRAIHVIAVISWMAGLLYLPRLFVYHSDAARGSELSETLKVMERRLLQIIMTPAMLVSWGLGLWLAWQAGYFVTGWFHAKLLAVVALSGAHGYLSKAARQFAADENDRPARHWRLVNEVPTVLMIVIVVLVIVKPF